MPADGPSAPARIATSVDLPAPFGPVNAIVSPARRSTSVGSSATCLPNRRETPCAARRGGEFTLGCPSLCGFDGRARGKDAGRAHMSNMGAPEDAASRRPAQPHDTSVILGWTLLSEVNGPRPRLLRLDLHLDGNLPAVLPTFQLDALAEELPHRARDGEQRQRNEDSRQPVDLAAGEQAEDDEQRMQPQRLSHDVGHDDVPL